MNLKSALLVIFVAGGSTQVDWKVMTKNLDYKYIRDQNLLKYFIGFKNKIQNIYRDQKHI
jgi:hypothetical protein